MGLLKVLGRDTSINVRKVLWAADVLGVAYQTEVWGLPFRDPKVPEFLALNPNAQVPVIIDDGFALWESNAILVYLAQTYGQGTLWSADGRRNALALQWLGWQAAELNPQWGYAIRALLRHEPGFDDPDKIAASVAAWAAKLTILEAQLAANGPYVTGEAFTVADIALGLSMHRWFSLDYPRQAFPALRRFYEMLKDTPAGAKWMTTRTP